MSPSFTDILLPDELARQQSFAIHKTVGSLFPQEWKFYQYSAPIGHLLINQSFGLRLLAWLCAQPWFQRIFHADVTIIRQFLTETKQTDIDPAIVIERTLLNHIWFAWNIMIITANPETEFASRVRIHGLAKLQEYQQQQRPILLVSYHTVFAKLLPLFAQLYGGENQVTIGTAASILKAQGQEATALGRTMQHARQLLRAQSVLANGGLVFMLPDGFSGKRGIGVPFFHRQREFKIGYAELALAANAVVLPIVPTLAADGVFELTLLDPLEMGTSMQPQVERIDRLVNAYIDFLKERWQEPWNIYLIHLAQHLLFPPMTEERCSDCEEKRDIGIDGLQESGSSVGHAGVPNEAEMIFHD